MVYLGVPQISSGHATSHPSFQRLSISDAYHMQRALSVTVYTSRSCSRTEDLDINNLQ